MCSVDIVYVSADQQLLHLHCEVPDGATVGQALSQSGIWNTHPETRDLPVGIFSRQVTQETLLKPGDRIELYRPLLIDPKEKRRQRAASVSSRAKRRIS